MRIVLEPTVLRFATVGLITTVGDIVLFAVLVRRAGLPPVPANLLSYSVGIATSFVLNRFWTFGTGAMSSSMLQHAGRFLASNLAGLALSTALVGVLVLLVPDVVAKLVAVPLVFVWNYALARAWVFR